MSEKENIKKPESDNSGTSTPPAPPADESKKAKKVEVDASVLEKLVKGFEAQEEKIKDLEAAADLGRLTKVQGMRNKGKLVKRANVSIHSGKVVVGWVKIKDDVYFDEGGKMHEDQQIALFLDDGEGKKPVETKPMSYRTFARTTTKMEGEVVKESKDTDGNLSFVILLEEGPNSGRKFELPIQFIN